MKLTKGDFVTDNGIATDELFSPGYVRFDCEVWGLPDNTMGKTGWHVVYRPLVDGYAGHELVTPEMRAAVRVHYAAQRAAKEDERATFEANEAEHERQQQERDYDNLYNEGGEGFNPYRAR